MLSKYGVAKELLETYLYGIVYCKLVVTILLDCIRQEYIIILVLLVGDCSGRYYTLEVALEIVIRRCKSTIRLVARYIVSSYS